MSENERGHEEAIDAGSGPHLPPRLQAERGPEGDLVRRYLRRPHGASTEKAWTHFESTLFSSPARGTPRTRRPVAALAVAVALGGLSLLVARWNEVAPVREHGPARAMARPDRRAVASGPPAAAAPVRERGAGGTIALHRAFRRIEPGRWTIAGEASLELTQGSAARVQLTAGGAPALSLAHGRVALAVAHKVRPAPFHVAAGPYVFAVLGTQFAVERGPTHITLVVSEGRVAVLRSGRRLATVSAGGEWSGRVKAPVVVANLAAETAADPTAAASTASPCSGGAPGEPRPTRLPCLRARAAGDGLDAQNALLQIALINHEDLHQPAAALATFEELRRRFPGGPLRAETDLWIVQLLAATGRHQEALDESAALLARDGGSERAAELRLLRGNLYREALGDLTRAEREYHLAADQAPGAPGADQDQILFLHAVTLEALGRRAEAAERYRRYLARERPLHEKQARERLERLQQTLASPRGSN